MERNGRWTESVAVGGEAFVNQIGARIRNRMELDIVEEPESGCWVVREASNPYGLFSGPKNACKPQKPALLHL